jgi:hypothetical protein
MRRDLVKCSPSLPAKHPPTRLLLLLFFVALSGGHAQRIVNVHMNRIKLW